MAAVPAPVRVRQTGGGVGGGAGGYSETVISSPSGTYFSTVGGAGGAGSAGTSGGIGGAGAAGVVIIYEYTTIGYSPNVGTLTANDYCSANSGGTQITCTTASTGSNNVVLVRQPDIDGHNYSRRRQFLRQCRDQHQ